MSSVGSLSAAPPLAATFMRHVVLPIAGLMAIGLVMAGIVAAWAAKEQNRQAVEGSIRIAQMALQSQIQPLVGRVTDYAPWDELFQRVGPTIDRSWLDEHVGRWVRDNYGDDMTFVVGPDDATAYALVDGDRGGRPVENELAQGVEALIAASRRAPTSRSVRHGLVRGADGTILVVAAAAIRPADDRVVIDGRGRSLLVLAARLDDAAIAGMSRGFGLRRLRLVTADAAPAHGAVLPLAAADGSRLGALAWQPDHPGNQFLKRVVPAFGLGVLLLTPVVWLVLGQARRAAAAIIADERRARFLALHDALTGLPNRVLFTERLERTLAAARAGATSLAVLWLDLDHFKEVNDHYGHAVGDLLLAAAAERFRDTVRGGETVARLGGDEFAILLEAERPAEAASLLAERLLTTLAAPFSLDGHKLHVSLSIGVAVADAESDAGSLARHADLALYRVKRAGRAGFAVHEPHQPAIASATSELEPA